MDVADDAANDEAMQPTAAEPTESHAPEANDRARTGGRGQAHGQADSQPSGRAIWLVACTSLLLFLPLQHGHFKGSDELAMFEMTRSLYQSGDLAVPPIRHTEVGRGGQRYSYFMPGQAFLALPLYALAGPLERVLPEILVRALAGPPNKSGLYLFGGELETTLVGLLAPLCAAALVTLFFAYQLFLGVRPSTAAILAVLLAVSTHTAVMSTYFLRHTLETIFLLGALLSYGRFARGAGAGVLLAGSALASTTILFRVPASISGPVLAGFVLHAFRQRGLLHGGIARLALPVCAVLAPLSVAILTYALINDAKWGAWFSSPMLGQQARFDNPLWRGVAGLLLSPGSSVLVYSPLLALAPAGLGVLWRRERAEAFALLALFATFVVFYARFDGWSGLWSAPGPRYLYPLVPLLLLPLGLFIDSRGSRASLRRAWMLVAGLAALGFWVQLVSIFVRWGSVPTLAGYPILGPDQADFLFEIGRSPVVVMTQLFLADGPYDSWLLEVWNGWPGFSGRPGAVVGGLLLWAALLATSGVLLARAVRQLDRPAPLEPSSAAGT